MPWGAEEDTQCTRSGARSWLCSRVGAMEGWPASSWSSAAGCPAHCDHSPSAAPPAAPCSPGICSSQSSIRTAPTQLQGPPFAVPMAQAVPTEFSASPPSTHTAVLWAPASALPEGCSQNTFDLSCTSYLGAIHLLLIVTFMIKNRHRSPLAGTAQQCRQVDNTSQENRSHTEPICGWKCPKSNSFPSCHPMPQCSELTQAQAASPAAAAQEEHGLGQLVLLFKYSTCFSPIPHPHT